MTGRFKAFLSVGLLAMASLASTAAAAAPAADWRVLADCSAAYLVNSKIPDPGRPAAMTSQIADVAADYAAAAGRRLVAEGGGSAARAKRTVTARVTATSRLLSREPREAIEKRIEACPQPDD